MKDEGFSYTQIAKILNDEGVYHRANTKIKSSPS